MAPGRHYSKTKIDDCDLFRPGSMDKIFQILQLSEFLDGSDFYRLFSTGKFTWKLFNVCHLDKLASSCMNIVGNKENAFEYVLSHVAYLYRHTEKQIFYLQDWMFCYIMRLVLMSCGHRICYYCKIRCEELTTSIVFSHKWSRMTVPMFDTSTNNFRRSLNYCSTEFLFRDDDDVISGDFPVDDKFGICSGCIFQYKFVTLASFANCNALKQSFQDFVLSQVEYEDFFVRIHQGVYCAPIGLLRKIAHSVPDNYKYSYNQLAKFGSGRWRLQ